ncbi:MAG TPA: ABC transporter permease [Candidatus Flavonifractor merdavium]|nr:ABC transporter permease [Candidatus Flavonifractor merdavium]
MKRTKVQLFDLLPLIALVVLVIAFGITSQGRIFSPFNLKSICTQSIPVIIGGLGVMFAVAMGGCDLSVGAVAAVSATVGAWVGSQYGLPVMILVALLIGLVSGIVVGFIVSRLHVPSFMVTLAMLIGMRGFVNALLSAWGQVYNPDGLGELSSFGASMALVVVLVIVVGYVFEKTSFGYYCKGMGENENTMKSIGVDTAKVRHIAYIISGVLASVMGLVLISSVGGSSSTLGQFMEMKIQMAIFLGGVLVTGGIKSKIYKLILGSLSITVITNGLTLSGAGGGITEMVEGILLMLILFVTIKTSSLPGKGRSSKDKNKQAAAVG